MNATRTVRDFGDIDAGDVRPAPKFCLWQGVGPVQLGMTVEGAERALGTKLEPRSLVYTSDGCYQTSRADKKDPGITYVVEDGKITVINVFSSDGQTLDVIDKHRLGIGADRRRHPARLWAGEEAPWLL